MNARTIVRRVGGSAAADAAAGLLERVLPVRDDSLHVLMYHRVAAPGERPDLHPGMLSATPEGLEAQATFLEATGRVVSLKATLAALAGGPRLPAGAILITFDDAYTDFAQHAWPRLAAHGLPVTLFVPTAYPDDPERSFWLDRLHVALDRAERRDRVRTPAGALPLRDPGDRAAARKTVGRALEELDHDTALAELDQLCQVLEAEPPAPAVLSWSELVRLSTEGVTLAPHTRTHPLLAKIPLPRAVDEVVGSRDDLAARLGETPPTVAYPGGSYTDELVGALLARDIRAAFTTRRGCNRVGTTDPLRLDRINVGIASALPLLRTQLLLVR